MYGIQLPPEQLRRHYFLQRHHDQGSVKAQVVIAVEAYLEEKEKQYETCPSTPRSDPGRANHSG